MRIIKNTAVFLGVISLMIVTCLVPASALIVDEGDFGFELNSYAKYATLVQYSGTDAVVEIPYSYHEYPVKKIAKTAFSGNNNISGIRFSTSVETLDEKAFMNCVGIEQIDIPSFVNKWGKMVFTNCTSLQKVAIYSEMEEIPAYSFAGCRELNHFSIHSDNIHSIGAYAFQDCMALSEADFLTNITSIGYSAFDGTGLKSISLSSELTEIPSYAFANCQSLSYVEISPGVNSIAETAFYNCPRISLGVYTDSYAHQYAIDNNIPFVLLDNVILGDVNADNTVDVADVTRIQQFIAELAEINGVYLKAGDVNNDDIVNIADATAIQMFLAEFNIPYPIGEVMTQ